MKAKALPLCLALILISLHPGCHGIRASTDNATLKTGLRYDQDGRLTDEPEVTIPVWKSKGLKPKPENVTPVQD